MSVFNKLKSDVYDGYKDRLGRQEFLDGIDPTMFANIGQILGELIMAIQDCLDSTSVDLNMTEAQNIAQSPSWLQRRYVKFVVANHVGRWGFRRKGGDELVASILEKGSNLTSEELRELLEEG